MILEYNHAIDQFKESKSMCVQLRSLSVNKSRDKSKATQDYVCLITVVVGLINPMIICLILP